MDINNSVDRIKNLDLEPIMVKALDKEEGLGWNLSFTKKITEEYRKYLILCLENPDKSIVPSKYVDQFCHLHILDTRKYQEDCKNIFGYFLHHFPYFGMRSEQDSENLQTASNETKKLYEKKFGSISPEL